MSRSEVIDVRVSQRILWVGAEAYPLHNIARAQTVKLVPRRGFAVGGFVKAVLLWAVLGAAAAGVLRFADVPGSDMAELTGYVVVGALVLVAFSTIRLLVALSRRTFYALVIETAGTPRRAVISPDERTLNQLVHQIMQAINDPQANFQVRVQNYISGNHFNQYGNHSVGMVNK